MFYDDRASTRVHRPPGGASSLSLAWGEEEPRTSRSFAASQDTDARTPSTARSQTSHARIPPGGASSLSLYWSDRESTVALQTPGVCSSQSAAQSACASTVDAFGLRTRENSNTFATGSQQNCGNALTNTPSTRVNAPPGGRSSICLGGDAGDLDVDTDPLRCSTGRMSRQLQEDTDFARSESNAVTSYGHSDAGRGGSTASWKEKPEVEGSRPKKWKPALNPRAPPGGAQSYTERAADARFDGKKLFPDAGAGNNRDLSAMESLRFYQDPEQRLGKQHLDEQRPHVEKRVHDSHRYHIEPAGSSDRMPGKARMDNSQPSSRQPLLAWEAEEPSLGRRSSKRQTASSQSTCADSSEAYTQQNVKLNTESRFSNGHKFMDRNGVRSPSDDIPLGADWTSFSR